MIKKILTRFISLIVALPFAGIILLISPLFRIRFIQLFSSRIGHYAINTEIILCALDAKVDNDQKSKVIFYTITDQPICNSQLHKMWKRELNFFPLPSIAEKIDKLLMRIGGKKYQQYPLKNLQIDCQDRYNLLEKIKKCHLSFTVEEELRGKELMQAMGIPAGAPFICLLVRDSGYLNNYLPSVDWSYHQYRDADINSYELAANYLAEQGYYVIRMGKFVKDPFELNNPKVIDYANSKWQSDFMDIYLSAYCFFFLSTCTGLDSVARVFRKPMLVTNLVLADFDIWHPWKIFLPKKILNLKTNKILTFKGMNKLYYQMEQKKLIPKLMEENNLVYIDNTPEELKAVTEEMLLELKGIWRHSEEDKILQNRFWEIFPKYFLNDNIPKLNMPVCEAIKVRIGAEFLRNNKSLLTDMDITRIAI